MKGIVRVAFAAAAVAGANAQPHQHQHQHQHLHRHVKKHDAAGLEKRAIATVTTVVPATVTSYVLEDGEAVEASKAQKGIQDGLYIVMGSSTPTFSPPAPASTSAGQGGQFLEIKSSSTAAAPSSSSAAAAPSSSSVSTSGTGLNADFPSGKIPCSHFPSDYGALGVSWLNTGDWTSIQSTGSWIPGVKINNIVAGIAGEGCIQGSFCSYACPPGYQKTQWPETSQGATGQSIGGLWCNSDGMLELTRPSYTKLCEPGVGGVTIQNKLSGSAAVCRTDYPASENMVIPIDTKPGNSYPLTNPDSNTYYVWEGKVTTAQYYVNPLNVAVADACCWTSPTNPDSAGNWAPLNIGLGRAADGNTYISLFANLPTSSAKLDFNIEILGGNAPCWYKDGAYYNGGTGCTV
ncbi:SUN-domain-containing protein, partial [Thozetella sp. PMI_491]